MSFSCDRLWIIGGDHCATTFYFVIADEFDLFLTIALLIGHKIGTQQNSYGQED